MASLPPPDPAHDLQRDIYLRVVDTLRGILPELPGATADAIARRDRVAIAQVAALVPGNPDEAFLAAHAVAALAHAADCQRELPRHAADPVRADQLRAQAALMGREARGYRAALLRAQAARARREASPALCDSAAWTEHCVHGLMADALETLAPAAPSATAAPMPDAIRPAASSSAPARPAPPSVRQPADPAPDPAAETLSFDPLAEAEHYALHYPRRARLIRSLGRLPDDCNFGPPEPAVVDALIRGSGPVFSALDAPAAVAA